VKSFSELTRFIEVSSIDYRDVLAPAEYPGYSKVGFGDISKSKKKKLYISDWKEYSAWLNET
jgi:hypothetical protein